MFHLCSQIRNELARVQWLAEHPVVLCAPFIEVRWQILIRIAPPLRANDPYFFAPQLVAQRLEHADLICGPLDPLFAAYVDEH